MNGMHKRGLAKEFSFKKLMLMLCLLCITACLLPNLAHAGAAPASPPPEVCTDTDPSFSIIFPAAGEGIVSKIIGNLQTALNSIAAALFAAVNSGISDTVRIVLSLYIAINGILFTFGMVRFTLFEFGMRMIKIGIIVTLLSPAAWTYFTNDVVYFFNGGTDAIISKLTSIAVGGVQEYDPTHPFAVVDNAVAKAFSAKMAVTWMATVITGPYGAIYALVMLLALGYFVHALLTVALVYLMSLVVKTLLFGLAPIFISCMLFNRTRHLFDGWINQLVNASLQPIMLFAFFAFFVKLIEGTIDIISNVAVCWTNFENVPGSTYDLSYWRFKVGGAVYKKWFDFMGADPSIAPVGTPPFPIDLTTVLVFLILGELCVHFNRVVLMIASELASAGTDLLAFNGSMFKQISPMSGKKDGLGSIGSRGRPDRSRVPAAARERFDKMQEEGAMETLRNRIGALGSSRQGPAEE